MRIALAIEYEGTGFLGWQRLSHGPTLQAAVEAAVGLVADTPVQITCSGRTDAGVHARCQLVHFDAPVQRSMRAWVLGSNSRLPPGVAALWAQPVAGDFHARHSARARRYLYRVLNRAVKPALGHQYLAWERRRLDADRMHEAAQALVGEHDFSAFRTAQCQAPHPIRRVHSIEVRRQGEEVAIQIEANAFLHHMVRNIVGSLVPVGCNERPPRWIGELLAGRDRALAGPTAPPQGLCYLGPSYPAQWGLPAELTLPPGHPAAAG
ncbi:MAG TPA: tRNA pseudouridine(38-40) synthase TruA [Xanthomonadaceae bacterium]|nr:tRNA pseudouridine(38-40) synthase TruA [Xanthomonadaceae bacterium]